MSEKWNFSLQTIIALGAIAGVLVTAGVMFSELKTDTDRNSVGVERLTLGLEQNDSQTGQLELRVEHVEEIAADAIKLRRELDSRMAQMQSDLAVIKEALARMEKRPPQ